MRAVRTLTIRMLGALAESYLAAVFLGLIIGAIVWVVLTAQKPDDSYDAQAPVSFVAAGAILGWLIAFVSRRIITVGEPSQTHEKLGAIESLTISPESRRTLLIIGSVVITLVIALPLAAFVIDAGRDWAHPASTKCARSEFCSE
jgi:hypothetical protein